MSDLLDGAWLDTTLRAARPRGMAALLRYFRDLDTAEEAFQEACLRALERWPQQGPPRDPAAWLILVGRNSGIDSVKRRARDSELPPDEVLSDLDDAEPKLARRLDEEHYRDDILRLLFICCHPELPATQQIPLALRLVSGLTVRQIARAFLVSEAAMEQRITRGKSRVADARLPFDAPAPAERAERLDAVASVLYLMFNEGYSAPVVGGSDPASFRSHLSEEAIRLARLLLRLFPEPSIMGLLALMLLHHSRAAARLDVRGNLVLLDDQDRGLWNRELIEEGLVLLDKATRHDLLDPYQVQAAIAACHARAMRPDDTNWAQIETLYGLLETLQPSAVVTLNRAVAVAKVRGPAAALDLVAPLEEDLGSYFYFHGLRGALLLQLERFAEARVAFDRAIALAGSAAEAAHIRGQIDRLTKESAAASQKGGRRLG